MQVKKLYAVSAFGIDGIVEVVSIVKNSDSCIYYVKQGDFLAKTWGNDRYDIKVIDGQKVLGINKTHFKYVRELSSLEQELY